MNAIQNNVVDALVVSAEPSRPPVRRSARDHIQLANILADLKPHASVSLLLQVRLENPQHGHYLHVVPDRLRVDVGFAPGGNIETRGQNISFRETLVRVAQHDITWLA